MRTIFTLTIVLFINSIFAQEWVKTYQWIDSTITSTEYIRFYEQIDSEIGYFSTTEGAYMIPGEGHLYKTTNSGYEWNKIYTINNGIPGASAQISFHFLDEQIFFLYEVKNCGLCYGKYSCYNRTSTFGYSPYYPPYQKILAPDTIIISHYTDANYIFIRIPSIGNFSKILIEDQYSYNYPPWSDNLITKVHFTNGLGTAIGKNQNGQYFFFTSNSTYDEWTKDSLFINGNINKLYFADKKHGFIICDNSTLFRTNDGGQNWNEVPLPENLYLYDIKVGDSKAYISADEGRVLSSSDYGVNWTIEQLETNHSIAFLSVVGNYAHIIDEDGQFFTNSPSVVTCENHKSDDLPKIYPNPAQERITIDSKQKIQSIHIYNNQGHLILNIENINNNTHQVNITWLNIGHYIVKTICERDVFALKFIKE